jgi:hypothetical protein
LTGGLEGTTVTAVLIGAQTAVRLYVDYEIERSIARGNGLLGVYIHTLKDQYGFTTVQGSVPWRLQVYSEIAKTTSNEWYVFGPGETKSFTSLKDWLLR